MSYSVSEHVDHVDGCLVFAKALYEHYPEARHEKGRWFSAKVPISECDTVGIESVASNGLSSPTFYMQFGKQFAGGVIWSDARRFGTILPSYLSPANHHGVDDALRRALLEWAAK